MISIFTLPKSFKDHTGLIQRNAIKSWKILSPEIDIILFGDDEGVEDFAKEMNLRYGGPLKRNASGTPMMDDMFAKASSMAKFSSMCYINADIILLGDFMEIATRVKQIANTKKYLVIGQRWNIDWDINNDTMPGWQNTILEKVRKEGKMSNPAYDYFLYSKGLFDKILPFAIGRLAFDIWFMYHAHNSNALLIDVSENIKCIHQNHNYKHIEKDYIKRNDLSVYNPEVRNNLQICGSSLLKLWLPVYTISGQSVKLNCIETLKNFYYALRRKITWRIYGLISWI